MPALLTALVFGLALTSRGELHRQPGTAIALLLAWGLLVLVVHALDLRRHRLDPLRPRLDVRRLRPAQVFLAALLVRALLLPSPPSLSDDIWRYIAEGHAALHGGNPYLDPPAAPGPVPELGIRALVNHPEVPSVYPPLAVWIFALLAAVAPGALLFKAAFALADAGVAASLAAALRARGRSTANAWLYAVFPLPALESAGSGHMDALALLGLALALAHWSQGRSGIGWAGLGGLVKLLPLVLLPTLRHRQPWLLLLVGLVGLAAAGPFLDAGPALLEGLTTYARHWSFNAGGYQVLRALFGLVGLDEAAARAAAAFAGAGVVVGCWWRLRDPARVALWVGGAFVLLSPTVHPWYTLWVWVPALVCGVRSWTVLVLLAPLSYAAWASYDPATRAWQEPAWPAFAIWLPLCLAALAESLWQQVRPGPWSPAPAPRAEAGAR